MLFIILSAIIFGLLFGHKGITFLVLVALGVLFNPITMLVTLIGYELFNMKGK